MLKKLFIFDANQPTVWYRVILWWELRRWLLNLLLLLFTGFFCLVSFFKYDGDPRFSFVYLISAGYFLLWTNIFYTFGWILHLILRLSGARFIKFVVSAMFVFSLGLTFAAASVSTFSYLFFSEMSASNYHESDDPCVQKLSGIYEFTKESRAKMSLPEDLQFTTKLHLNLNEDFSLDSFPSYQNSDSLTAYRLINAVGRWSCKPDNNGVIVLLKFEGGISDATTYERLKDFTYRDSLRLDDLQNPELYLMVGNAEENKKLFLEKIQY